MSTKPIILITLFIAGISFILIISNSKNKPAPVFCERTILISATPQKVWGLLTNINGWSKWQKNVSKARLNGALKPNTTFDWKASGFSIHSNLTTVSPNKELAWTGKTLSLYAIHNWKFKEVNGSTQVIVSESMSGFLAGLFAGSLNKSLQKDMEESLKSMKAECEKI